jgi:hypothetical protein
MRFKKQEIQHAIENKLGLKPRIGREQNAYIKMENGFTIRITYPKGSGDLHPKTLPSIKRQTLLGWDDFSDLIKCPLSGNEYFTIIRNKIKNNLL